jgi:FixJ family two-component response regulator
MIFNSVWLEGIWDMTRPLARIALACDDAAVRDALAALIEAYDFEVRAFGRGRELLEVHVTEPSRCIVVDHQMPGFTGLELLRALRARGDITPVILITDESVAALCAKANVLGGAVVLLKPLSPAELMAALHKMVARSDPSAISRAT